MSSEKKSPRKILRDSIQGITDSAIKRLAYTAGEFFSKSIEKSFV